MTKPTETTNPVAAIAQVLALQSKRISRMEATLREVKAMLEATRPHEGQEKGQTP